MIGGLCGWSLPDCKPADTLPARLEDAQKEPVPVLAPCWNNRRSFLFPSPRRPIIRVRQVGPGQRGRLRWNKWQDDSSAVGGLGREGCQTLSLQEDKEGRPRRKPDPSSEMTEATHSSQKKRRVPATEVGEALKSVYQRTVNEDIPPEMLDLLGKLG
jgi:hypothetical protein